MLTLIRRCPKVYPFDHMLTLPDSGEDVSTVFLYADPSDEAFSSLHHLFSEYAKAGKIRYVLRWRPSAQQAKTAKKLVLSGYGAGLDLKRVDYLTIDDRDLAGATETADAGTAAAGASSTTEVESAAGTGLFDDGDTGAELVQLKPAQLQGEPFSTRPVSSMLMPACTQTSASKPLS